MATSTKWRLLITANSGDGAYAGIGELVMASSVGGANLCTGGIITASSYSPGWVPSLAFDGVLETAASSGYDEWIAGSSLLPQWIQYEFPTTVSVAEYGINVDDPSDIGDPSQGNRCSAWQLQYWNGSSWITVDSRAQTLTPRGMDYFTVTPGVAPIRLAQGAVEVLRSNGVLKEVRLAQSAVEVLRFNGYAPVGAVGAPNEGQPIYPGDTPTGNSWFMMF